MTALPLPADEDLPEETRQVLDNLPPLNVFRAVAGVPASFLPFMQLGGSLLSGPGDRPAQSRDRDPRASPAPPTPPTSAPSTSSSPATSAISDEEIAAIRDGDAEAALDADGALAFAAADRDQPRRPAFGSDARASRSSAGAKRAPPS